MFPLRDQCRLAGRPQLLGPAPAISLRDPGAFRGWQRVRSAREPELGLLNPERESAGALHVSQVERQRHKRALLQNRSRPGPCPAPPPPPETLGSFRTRSLPLEAPRRRRLCPAAPKVFRDACPKQSDFSPPRQLPLAVGVTHGAPKREQGSAVLGGWASGSRPRTAGAAARERLRPAARAHARLGARLRADARTRSVRRRLGRAGVDGQRSAPRANQDKDGRGRGHPGPPEPRQVCRDPGGRRSDSAEGGGAGRGPHGTAAARALRGGTDPEPLGRAAVT